MWKVLTTVSLQTPHSPKPASRYSCVRSGLTSSEMWSQCSISLWRSGCLLMSVSVSGSLCSPSMKYTSSCSRTSEVTWRTMRCKSAVEVRIPISELNETFSYQIWSGFPPPKNQLDSGSVLLCLVGATHVCISWGSITSMKNRSRTAFAIATAVVWNKSRKWCVSNPEARKQLELLIFWIHLYLNTFQTFCASLMSWSQ